MKRSTISVLFLLVSACSQNSILTETKPNAGNDANSSSADLIYLGQEPPGLTPKPFAPGIVSTKRWEAKASFAPNMKEFYYRTHVVGEKAKSYVAHYQNGKWVESVFEGLMGFISTDNKTMYFNNDFRERTADGWSEKKKLGPPFNEFTIMRLTASATGTYVFDERDETGTIRYSQTVDGQLQAPKEFGEAINSGKWTAHPFIAPDESYLIWDSERDSGFGSSDLYISFRQQDGSWGSAINMGEEINTAYDDAYGSVTPDGKYFFFHSQHLDESNIYWVDFQAIEKLKSK